jgi:multicomponent Na+:H+ antiporter subunit D
MKGTLFLCAGVIIHETGKRNISEMNGIGRRLPITMGAFTVAVLGMIGIPATCGFITKWELGLGTIQAHRPYFIAIILVSSLLNAVYFLPIVYAAYFKKGFEEAAGERRARKLETRGTMLVPAVIGAAMVIILGVFVTAPGLPYQLVKVIVKGFGF